MNLKARLAKLEQQHQKARKEIARPVDIVAGELVITKDPAKAGTSIREAEKLISYGLTLEQAIAARDEYAGSHDNLIILISPLDDCNDKPISGKAKSMNDAELIDIIFGGVEGGGVVIEI